MCGTLFKALFLLVSTCIGFIGVVLQYYGTHKSLNVSLEAVEAAGVNTKLTLTPFIDCQDIADQKLDTHPLPAGANHGDVRAMLVAQCMEPLQLPAGTLFNTAATFSLFSLMSGFVAGCKDVKGNLYAYTIVSAASIALSIVSIAWMASISASAMKTFAPCKLFNNATVTVLEQDFDFQCVTFQDSVTPDVDVAVQWMSHVWVFYAGCILSVISLLFFMVMNSCCSKDREETQKKPTNTNYKAMPY